MTNLVTCAGCGKKISRNALECPDCKVKYIICRICAEPIMPSERMHVVSHDSRLRLPTWRGIHLSCLEYCFLFPTRVECPDCGQHINCPKFSVEDFIEKDYTMQKEMCVISCSNCGNPDVLKIKNLPNEPQCPCCELLVIPGIQEYTRIAYNYYHSFCDPNTIHKKYMWKEFKRMV